MGMDAYIYRARSKKVFDKEDYYANKDVTEEWYARKFWDLVNQLSFVKDEDYGDFIPLTKDNLEEMIKITTHTPDFFNTFDTVPRLCEILYNFDDEERNGWHYYFEYDY